MTRLWVVKWNWSSQFADSGDWREFFKLGKEDECGGDWGTHNHASLAAFREMTPGDFVLAYQTNLKAALGLCHITRLPRTSKGKAPYCRPVCAFDLPVKLHELKHTIPDLKQVRALRQGLVQTCYATTMEEARVLLRACGTHASLEDLEEDVAGRNVLPFGLPENNKKVEVAAVEFVKRQYRSDGWKVRSVERLNLGYDLECERGGKEECVEVKGVSGSSPVFILTRKERDRATDDRRFIFCVVTGALTTNPALHRWTGRQLVNRFRFEPIAYRVSPL